MKLRILSLLVFIVITSFAKSKDGVLVIFKNNTGKDFRIFKASLPGRELVFFNLKSGQQTAIVTAPRCYRYCYAQAITDTDTLLCQPDDYVGEISYSNGKILMNVSSHSQKGLEKSIEVWGTWDADHFVLPKKYVNQ